VVINILVRTMLITIWHSIILYLYLCDKLKIQVHIWLFLHHIVEISPIYIVDRIKKA